MSLGVGVPWSVPMGPDASTLRVQVSPGVPRGQHSPLLSLWWVCCLAQSAGIPWISTRTKGSTMELPLSLFSLGSCCAVITCGTGDRDHGRPRGTWVWGKDWCPQEKGCGWHLAGLGDTVKRREVADATQWLTPAGFGDRVGVTQE